jgi:ankyrin repeat protein
LLGEDHPDTLRSMNNLTKVLRQQGKHLEVEQMQRRTLEIRENVLGIGHSSAPTKMNMVEKLGGNQADQQNPQQRNDLEGSFESRKGTRLSADPLEETVIFSDTIAGNYNVLSNSVSKFVDKDSSSLTLLLAAQRAHKVVVKPPLETDNTIVNKNDRDGLTPLSWAASLGHEAVARLLLAKGAELGSKDTIGRTPLSLAARNGHEAVVKLLLEQGAELESKDNSGGTPLSLAARNGHEDVVKLLLDQGADLESKDNSSGTPLLLAARNGHEAVVKLLLERGAELESKDNSGGTSLLLAARNGHESVVEPLLIMGQA